MATMIEMMLTTLSQNWALNADYGDKLTADLSPEQMVYQPELPGGAGMNHPAWVLSHLNAYHPVILDLLEGRTPEDPIDHPFGMKSKPTPNASDYAEPKALREAFAQGHDAVAKALTEADEARMNQAIPIARWAERFPLVGSALPYLMIRHEALHLGQLSAWRRVQGLPAV